VREIVRQNLRFFLLASLAALVLRLVFLLCFPRVTEDSLIYVELARNWWQHGTYGLTTPRGVAPTFIRLPGYPAFLAAIFAIFGAENYRAVLASQILFDLGACFVVADIARRIISARASKAAFLLAGLCPFLANYAAAALSETLEIFFTALALDCAVAGLHSLPTGRLRPWLGCGLAIGAAILVRPDGGLLLAVVGGWTSVLLLRSLIGAGPAKATGPHLLRANLILFVAALAPLAPWTLRNEVSLHRFQPLAPRYANDDGEFVAQGFNRWTKTWIADYVSVEEIYWPVPGDEIDVGKLPVRAFDSPQQRERTAQLLADYNVLFRMTPELDSRFAALAAERIRAHPLRYYVWLPALRIADMWLRPRTELLPCDTRWLEFHDDPKWSALAVALGVIGLGYFGAALTGWTRIKVAGPMMLLIVFVTARSIFLGSLENPEPRYTLECYPAVLVLCAVWFR
jgi:4-amino-4-deoxy-L-arabinose transferase-like glycosyltransferase